MDIRAFENSEKYIKFLEEKVSSLELEIANLKRPKQVGTGYYAIPENEDYLDCINWYIVDKSFYDTNGHIDDQELDLDIPNFSQDMESCFSYQPDYPSKDLEKQSKLLTEMGFTII